MSWDKHSSKWHARIASNNHHRSLGLYIDQADAALVYNFAAVELHGFFAVLNEAPQTCPLVA